MKNLLLHIIITLFLLSLTSQLARKNHEHTFLDNHLSLRAQTYHSNHLLYTETVVRSHLLSPSLDSMKHFSFALAPSH